MRKISCFILCLISAGLIAGCNGGDGPKSRMTAQTTGIRDVIESQMSKEAGNVSSASEETTSAAPETESQTEQSSKSSDGNSVDFDLTDLGPDILYAEVYSMMVFPDQYLGRTIKVAGIFTVYYDEARDNYHFACFVSDAAACCQQGIEFILDGDKAYPSDYPQEGAEITVTGVFGTYEEDGNTYWALTDAVMEGN